MKLSDIAKHIISERRYLPMGKAKLSINQLYPGSLNTDDRDVKHFPWGDVSYTGQEFLVHTSKGNARYPWPKGKIGTLELSDGDFKLNEDTWGNWPSAAGSMSPGKAPNATSPAPSPTGRNVDIANLFKNFKSELEKQEDAAVKKLVDQLKKNFLKKNVQVKASKGSVGQIEKEYNVNVDGIDVRYMKDKYFIVFTGKEGDKEQSSEYYLDDSVVEVDDAAKSISPTGRTGGMEKPTMADTTKKNILPQK